jgi:nicotinamide-nucleotide amidase
MSATIASPTCEIITIGSELLLGQIMDTNTAYLAQQLRRIGVTIHFRTAVGDRLEAITRVVRSGVERCDMVITTGGLGPTLDDLTRESVARVAGVELEFRQDLMDQIEEYFRRAGYKMPGNNRRQAYIPAGSQVIPNPVGTAPGFITEVNGKPIICLPGVPRELKVLLSRDISPWIRKRFGLTDHRLSYRVLKVVGIGESGVDRLIGDLMGSGKNPEVGLLASPGEIRIRITATAGGEMEAKELIRPVEETIRSRLGKKIFGSDDDTLEGVIDSLLIQKGLTLAILETFTAGLAAQRLYRIPSSCLVGSRVVPDKERLFRLLDKGHGQLDVQSASFIAQRVRDLAQADVALSIVGFPEKKDETYVMDGYAAATGDGIEKDFSWQMGGPLRTLQERGAVIGLNTLRLALLSKG